MARQAAAAVRNLSCEAASRECVRESDGVEKLASLLASRDVEVCHSEPIVMLLAFGCTVIMPRDVICSCRIC